MGRFVVDPELSTWFASLLRKGETPSRHHKLDGGSETVRVLPMNDAILQEISDFCRQTGLAESTFGRRAVNDGKLASRLRNGGRITTDTLDRIRAFMAENRGPSLRSPVIERNHSPHSPAPSILPAI